MASPQSAPEWDEERARWLVGKVVVVGLTRLAADGKSVVAREQFHGVIEAAEQAVGIRIACKGASPMETMMLPPTTKPFLDAKPGPYHLKPSGDIVKNPAVTVSWTLTDPQS